MNNILLGDSSEELVNFNNESIDMIITSPPYKDRDGFSMKLIHDVFSQCFRVLKKDSICWVNFGHMAHEKEKPFRVALELIEIGFDLHETFIWVKNHYRPLQGKRRVNNLTEYVFQFNKGKCPELDRLSVGVKYQDKCLSVETPVFAKVNEELRYTNLRNLRNSYTKGKEIFLPSYDFCSQECVWTKVNAFSEIKKQKVNEINFINGTSVKASCEHKFPIFKKNDRSGKDVLSIISVNNLEKRIEKWKSAKQKMYFGIDFRNLFPKEDKVSPIYNGETGYVLGLYLAEGFKFGKKAFRFACHEDEFYDEKFGLFLDEYFEKYFKLKTKKYAYLGKKSGQIQVDCGIFKNIIENFIFGENAKDKRININECIKYGVDFVSGIIDGFLVGDGHYVGKYDYYSIGICDNQTLVDNLRFLCSLVGYEFRQNRDTFTTIKNYGKYKKKNFLIRKDLYKGKRVKRENGLTIEGIDKINVSDWRGNCEVNTVDVEVDIEHSLFFLANGIMTHNSNIKRWKGTEGRDIKCGGNVWNIPYETIRKKEDKIHNDRFPIGLPIKCLRLGNIKARENPMVLDPFSGSGTTALACQIEGISCTSIEKNKEFYDISIDRLDLD